MAGLLGRVVVGTHWRERVARVDTAEVEYVVEEGAEESEDVGVQGERSGKLRFLRSHS